MLNGGLKAPNIFSKITLKLSFSLAVLPSVNEKHTHSLCGARLGQNGHTGQNAGHFWMAF